MITTKESIIEWLVTDTSPYKLRDVDGLDDWVVFERDPFVVALRVGVEPSSPNSIAYVTFNGSMEETIQHLKDICQKAMSQT